VKLAVEHHYPRAIVTALVELGHDVVYSVERGWTAFDDETLVEACVAEQRALLSNNAQHLRPIAARLILEGRHHYGLVLTDDTTMPRRVANVGAYVKALAALLGANPSTNALLDQEHWLRP
jgi:hypothetical protein